MFDKDIEQIRDYLAEKKPARLKFLKKNKWPGAEGRNVILQEETAIELGSPEQGSVSFILWTGNQSLIKDNNISVIGDDLPALYKKKRRNIPFGKIVLVSVKDFNEENTYQRYREIETSRFDVDLKGYMIKAVSQLQREWSRVSIEAIKKKFSFSCLGSELIRQLKKNEYVTAAEVVFITSNAADIQLFSEISERTSRIIRAMNKMFEEMSFDCSSCEFIDVCDEVEQLKEFRRSREEKDKGAGE